MRGRADHVDQAVAAARDAQRSTSRARSKPGKSGIEGILEYVQTQTLTTHEP